MPRRAPDSDPSDPAPALTRGLAILRLLSVNGPSLLEHLAQAGGWPKSSTLRVLTALERCGAAGRDPLTRRWHAQVQLTRAEETPGRIRLRNQLVDLAQASGCAAEAWEIRGDRLVLVERAGPDAGEALVRARIGFARDWREAEAVVLTVMAAGHIPPPRIRQFQHRGGKAQAVTRSVLAGQLHAARTAGCWADADHNDFGVRRFAAPWRQADGRLLGAIAIAQGGSVQVGRDDARLLELVVAAAARA